jgi:tetratricopeptide (TPR) repeat protein
VKAARVEAEAIATIGENTDFSGMIAGGVPVPDLLKLVRHVITARIAQAQESYNEAASEFKQAVHLQDALPYLEPPYWYYPVRQSLGAMLIKAGKPQEAERIFRRALEEFPNNGWALYGLMRAQKAQGNAASAARTQKRFKEAWLEDKTELKLDSL